MIPLRLELSLRCTACHAPITPHVPCLGTALVLSDRFRTLLRVGPAGAAPVLPPHPMAALVRADVCVAVAPGGDILLFGGEGDIVRLAPDGREIWCNEPAKGLQRQRDVAAQDN